MTPVEWLDGPFQGKNYQVTKNQLYDGFFVQVGAQVDGRYDSKQIKVYPEKTPSGWIARWPKYE